LLTDTNVYLAPEAAFKTAMPVGIPLAFTLCIYASTIDEQV
jgi:hypothetical protein